MKKIFFCSFIIILIFIKFSYSLENKVVVKVENEIITSIDIEEEYKYLIALNSSFKNIEKKSLLEYSKNSLIREKIKKIEILRNIEKIDMPDEILENIMKNVYLKLSIENINQFKIYLKENKIDYNFVKNKIQIEAIWNELIFRKFSSKININEENLKKEIKKNSISKSYFISEILFEISNSGDLKKKQLEIKKTIDSEGFESAALKHSISDSSAVGGKIGWIKENALSKNIKNKILNIKMDEYTDPITVPGGFLILKIDDIKKNNDIKNNKLELKKLINAQKNKQLNQFSTMYFNKIKKSIQINEI